MSEIIDSILKMISEQGVLVAFELLVIIVLCLVLKKLNARNDQLTDTIFVMHKETLNVVSKNSEVIAVLTEKVNDIKNQ